jgi:hypothetical protein
MKIRRRGRSRQASHCDATSIIHFALKRLPSKSRREIVLLLWRGHLLEAELVLAIGSIYEIKLQYYYV